MNIPTLPSIKIGINISQYFKIIVPGVTIVAAVLLLLFVVWPKFNDVLSLRSVNNDLAVRVGELETKAQKLSGYDKTSLESELGLSEALLPSSKDVFTLVAQIERSASSSGVVLEQVEVSPGTVGNIGAVNPLTSVAAAPNTSPTPADTAAGNTPSIQLKISVASDYKSFLQFLNSVLSIPRVLVIHDLSLSSVIGAGQPTGQIKTLITFNAYYLPLPSELPSLETPVQDLTSSELQRLNQVRGRAIPVPPVVPPQGGRSDLFAPF